MSSRGVRGRSFCVHRTTCFSEDVRTVSDRIVWCNLVPVEECGEVWGRTASLGVGTSEEYFVPEYPSKIRASGQSHIIIRAACSVEITLRCEKTL